MADAVFVPLVTPVDGAGNVCGASVGRLVRSLRQSAAGFVPCLTSGEGWRLTQEQWSAMLGFAVEASDGMPVIAGIERPSTAEVLTLAERAKGLGAAGIMMTAPFGKDVDRDATVRHFGRVHDAVDLDIHIYNESSLSGNETDFDTLLAIGALERVVGIKDSGDAPRPAEQIGALRALGVCYCLGWEQHLGRVAPADGCVVSLANIEPALCRVALAGTSDRVTAEVERLTEAYALLSEDWYARIKVELFARGVISTPRLAGS